MEGRWLWMEKDDSLRQSPCQHGWSILSVNSPLSVGSIHDGAKRMWKFRKVAVLPPVSRMQGFFEASPYFIVEGDMVRSLEPLDYHVVQGEITAAMIDVLKNLLPSHWIGDHSRRPAPTQCPRRDLRVWTTYAEWMENLAMTCGVAGSSPKRSSRQGHSRRSEGAAKGRVAQKGVGSGSCWQVCPDDGRDHLVRQLRRVSVFRAEIQRDVSGESLTVVHGGEK